MRTPLLVSSLLLLLFCLLRGCSGDNPQIAKRYVVDLDMDPEKRWEHVVKDYTALVPSLKNAILHFIPEDLVGVAEYIGSALDTYLPQPYAAEMRGISSSFNISLGEVVLLNIAYDFSAFCTSIVAQNENGTIYHGRNLDYGVTSLLRKITIVVEFQRKQKTIYMGTTYVGYVGLMTGQKPNAFTVSLDERDKGTIWMNLLSFLLDGGQFASFLLRDTLAEDGMTYARALSKLANTSVIAPSYVIIGGIGPGEGAVITRGRDKAIDVWHLNAADHRWYLLETNYDHWTTPSPSDDRRDPGIALMNKVGQANISPAELFKVLSTAPVLNNSTTYTTIMSAAHPDIYQAWIRHPSVA
ncbi:N-acylethanolamine-hydrolyzing acid amidase-like [Corticium candelabrum]|uniref:N-acylethanolamine-hydrolyzing acid amidase-like n=1 Tax=Corticium candelabrum TaxID=121492 RepID=UPI002E27139E|nr:N-acylethanolamine-hydrolyzing acid amidase-like [Corticium candelabrum]